MTSFFPSSALCWLFSGGALAVRLISVSYTHLDVYKRQDLHGCGDSSGDFGDASWAGWVDDVKRACDWLQQRFDLPLWLWGLRTGCLVAVEVANQIGSPARLLLWQPVVSGKQFLQQFLRLKIAGELLSGEGKGVMDRLRQQLAHGESVEVAGYTLSAALANGLENAELAPSGKILRIEWIEVSSKPDAVLSPCLLYTSRCV